MYISIYRNTSPGKHSLCVDNLYVGDMYFLNFVRGKSWLDSATTILYVFAVKKQVNCFSKSRLMLLAGASGAWNVSNSRNWNSISTFEQIYDESKWSWCLFWHLLSFHYFTVKNTKMATVNLENHSKSQTLACRAINKLVNSEKIDTCQS